MLDRVLSGGSQLLPLFEREALMRAAQTPVTEAAPLARLIAIEAVLERLRRQYPEKFRDQTT